jgi:hypothetical protein
MLGPLAYGSQLPGDAAGGVLIVLKAKYGEPDETHKDPSGWGWPNALGPKTAVSMAMNREPAGLFIAVSYVFSNIEVCRAEAVQGF